MGIVCECSGINGVNNSYADGINVEVVLIIVLVVVVLVVALWYWT